VTTRMTRVGAAAFFLLALTLALSALAGCSSDEVTTSTGGASPVQTSTTGASTTSTSGSLLSEWDRQLRDNAKLQHQFALYLGDIGAADDDPLMALYHGLQARTHALTCRKALAEDNLELADAAMLEVYYALNRGRNLAQGPVADALAGTYAIVETLGAPSKDAKNAAAVLDRFLEASAKLVDQVTNTLSSTTTTLPSTTSK